MSATYGQRPTKSFGGSLNYVERGCAFMLQPFTAEGESYGNKVSSTEFGVSKRYTDDLSPAYYNFPNGCPSTKPSGGSTTLSSTSTSLTSTPPTTTDSSATYDYIYPQDGKGLSIAAKIGIGLGVPLGVLIAAGTIGIFFWLRRKSRQRDTQETPATNVDEPSPLSIIEPKEAMYERASKTDMIDSQSLSSRDYQGSTRTGRPLSELMSIERTQLELL